MKAFLIIMAAAWLTVAGSACSSRVSTRPQAEAFQVELRARNDDGQPLAGVTWASGEQRLGETRANGALPLALRGREGQLLHATVNCPTGYVAPDTVPELRLTHTRRISDQQIQPLTIEVVCTRVAREIALVVHADRGPGLALLVDGKAAGSTDADGNAHVLLKVDRSVRKLDVALDSSQQPDLMPKTPTRSFELDGRDSLILFTETFSTSPKAKAKAPPRPKYVPYRVN